MPQPAAVYIIHHDPERADQLAQQLRSCAEVSVRPAMLQLAASDYADMAADPETAAVIVAQDLDPHGSLGYTGIDVAEHLRRARPALPIYLLAPRDQDLASKDALVEEVFPEDEFVERCPVHAARIQRAMGRYIDSMSDRERQYRELIMRKLDGTLSDSEEEELAACRMEIELPFAGSAIEHAKTWEQSLREEERLLKEFTTELQSLLDKLS